LSGAAGRDNCISPGARPNPAGFHFLGGSVVGDTIRGKIERAGEAVGDAAKKAGSKIKEGSEKVADRTAEAAKKTGQAAKDAGQKLKDKSGA